MPGTGRTADQPIVVPGTTCGLSSCTRASGQLAAKAAVAKKAMSVAGGGRAAMVGRTAGDAVEAAAVRRWAMRRSMPVRDQAPCSYTASVQARSLRRAPATRT